jgi:DNA mismatch repair protein MutS2
MDRMRTKLKQAFEQAREEIRIAVRRLEESRTRQQVDETRQKVGDVFHQAAARMENALREEAPEIADALNSSVEKEQANPIETGALVRVPKWNSVGTILELDEKRVKVALGSPQGPALSRVTMTLALHEVEPLSEQEQREARAVSGQSRSKNISASVDENVPRSLDLRGVRLEDAMRQLENYLDRAFRSGAGTVTIIHGLGTGAIKEGARRLFAELPYIKTFRDGGPGQGGMGASVVEFDR